MSQMPPFMLRRNAIRSNMISLAQQQPRSQPSFQPPTIMTKSTLPTSSSSDKMTWGKHVWNLIHTMTVLVNEDQFPRIKTDLLNMLFLVCTNLPCPICSDHAKEYLKSINFNAIQTKEQFKNLFHQFHNSVNTRKNYPLFPRDRLEETYRIGILVNMMQNFQLAFRDKSYNPKHIGDQHIRMRVLKMFTDWFSQNLNAFQ